MEFEFEPDNGLCVYRISGQITIGALMTVFAQARSHPDWSDGYDFLTLLSQASLARMSASAMDELQDRMGEADPVKTGPRRRAAIVCDDDLSRAMLTYWEKTASRSLTTEERIFSTEHAARAWLAETR